MAVHDLQALARWRSTFATWRSSGLTATAFCRSRARNASSFYRWRGILDGLDAHPLRKIFARIRWALTLALLQLTIRRLLGRGGNDGLLAAALPIPTILLAALLATGRASPVTPARLHPTPALRRATTLFVAITDLRMRRCEPPFTALQKTTTGSTRMGRNLLPERRR